MNMGMLDGLKRALQGVQDLQSGLRAVRAQLEAAQREREEIATAPTCRSDVKANFGRWIDGCAAEFDENLKRQMATMLRKPHAFEDLKSQTALNCMGVLSVSPAGGTGPTPRSVDVALMALLGPSLKTELYRVIDRLEWPSAEGLPMLERKQKIAELDRRIDKLLAEESELVQLAAANRIILD
jgi:hypothetical protein